MPITIEQAKQLKDGTILYDCNTKNSDGTFRRWRVNGQVKQWKRNSERLQISLKHGLYIYGYLTNGKITSEVYTKRNIFVFELNDLSLTEEE